MNFHMECPDLKGKKPEENIAIVHTWMSDMTDKFNLLINSLEKQKGDEGNGAE